MAKEKPRKRIQKNLHPKSAFLILKKRTRIVEIDNLKKFLTERGK